MAFVMSACLTVSAFAQSELGKSDIVVNVGLGIPAYLDGMRMPLLTSSFEIGIVDGLLNDKASIGVGGSLGITQNRESFLGLHKDHTHVIVGGRGAFHYAPTYGLDTYAGMMLGYDYVSPSASYYINPDYESRFASHWFIGIRYYFMSNIAVYGEAGYGVIAPIEAGIAFRF